MGREAEAGRTVGIARGRPLLRVDVVQVGLPFVMTAPVRGQDRQATRGKRATEPSDRALGLLDIEMSEQRAAEYKIVAFRWLEFEIRICWRAFHVEVLDHELFLACGKLAHENCGLGKHRAQVPRHSSPAAGKIEDSAKAGPVGCDHSSHDQIYRAATHLQVVIKVALKPATAEPPR